MFIIISNECLNKIMLFLNLIINVQLDKSKMIPEKKIGNESRISSFITFDFQIRKKDFHFLTLMRKCNGQFVINFWSTVNRLWTSCIINNDNDRKNKNIYLLVITNKYFANLSRFFSLIFDWKNIWNRSKWLFLIFFPNFFWNLIRI